MKKGDIEQILLGKNKKLQEMEKNTLNFQEQITNLSAKCKNMELAYRKLKNENKKMSEERIQLLEREQLKKGRTQ